MANQRLSKIRLLCVLILFIGINIQIYSQQPGNTLSFNGTNAYVTCGIGASLNITGNQISLEAWIKVNQWGSTYTRGPIISKAQNSVFGGYELRCGGAGQLSFNLGMGTGWMEIRSSTNALTLGQWYYVCGTYDGTTMNMYINGNLAATGSNSGNIANSSYSLLIGANSDYLVAAPNGRYFNGSIDEVRIWNVARTQAQIQASMYNVITSPYPTSLVAYYQMNASSGTTLSDLTTNHNNGTLTYTSAISGGGLPLWVESYAMVVPPSTAATSIGSTGFNANWTVPVVGTVSSYKLDVSTSNSFSSFVSGYNNLDCGTSLSQTVTGLSPTTTYYYRVRADKISVTGTGANYYTYITVTTVGVPTISLFTPTLGSNGTSVTITGTYLTGATAVSFGGTAASSFTVNSSTQVTAIVGTGSTGTVSVTTPGGIATLAGFTFLTSASWTGNTSTDWNTAGNWSPSIVPTASTNVNIPVTSNNPMVNQAVGSPAVCYNLTINSGVALTIAPGKALTVNGTLTNNAGNTGLVIQSTAAGTGSLIHNTASVNGTIQRYIAGSASLTAMTYHLVSVPLTQASNPTSNLFLGSYLYYFDETQISPVDNGWVNMGISTTTPLTVTRGYMVYYPGTSKIYNLSGPMNNGSVITTTSYTSGASANKGFNLVPNPYPSSIDWLASSGWTKTNIDNAVYVWNSSNYASYINGGSTNGGSRYIAPGQSFFVHANATSPVLAMNNSVRTHNTVSFLKDNGVIPNLLKIHADADSASDEIVVRFANGATTGFDGEWDAYKITGGADAPQMYTVTSDNINLAINSLPLNPEPIVVPLDFTLNSNSEVTLTASGIESFNPSTTIYLEDKTLGKMVNLRTDPLYTFSYQTGSAANRFNLHFNGITGINENNTTSSGRAFISNGSICLEVPSMQGQLACITLYDMLGQVISNEQKEMIGIVSIKAPFAKGVYVVIVSSKGNNFITRVINK